MRDQVFISYSHKDERWLQKLRTHLKPFERTHQIQVWDDNKIGAGDKWKDKIEKALCKAKVAVLLVTPDYVASDFITHQELPPLLAAAESEGLKVIWVAVSASAYMETSIKDYQAANDTARPLDGLKPARLNEELVKICEAIKLAISGEGVESKCVESTPGRRARSETIEPGASLIIEKEDAPPAVLVQRETNLSKRTQSKRKLFTVLAGIIAVVVVGGVFAYSKLMGGPKRPPPIFGDITNTELDDEFLNLNKWTAPPTGWTINPDKGQGRLVIEKQPLPASGRGDLLSFRLTHQLRGESLFSARYNFTDDRRTLPSVNRGDGLVNLDLAFSKRLRFKESQVRIIRTEVFNVLNRANFGLPIRVIGAPGFGSAVDTATPARIIQFALKYNF